MASISRSKTGLWTVQFYGADGKRRSVRLGKVSKRIAESVKVRVEELNAAAIAGHTPDRVTLRWVTGLNSTLAGRLARARLIEPLETAHLDEFINGYIESRRDVKANTKRVWEQTRRHLVAYFGEDKPLRSVTKGDAKDWRQYLIGRRLADATVRKHCGFAKHFFAEAVDRRLIDENAFTGLKSSPIGNPDRQYFVNRVEIAKVFDACPDAEWRLIVALSRFGGLRCPSEHMALRWEDVHWDQDRLTVPSPKTERHAGHESRIVPLFPELLAYLEEAFELADVGAEYVLRRRRTGGNLRTQFARIIKRAGLKPWPRIFHNLRASRQTELDGEFPTHVVCAWIGNSPAIARKHYLQVTDDHFKKAVRNPVPSVPEMARTASQTVWPEMKQPPDMQGVAATCELARKPLAGVDGNRTHLATFQTPHWV